MSGCAWKGFSWAVCVHVRNVRQLFRKASEISVAGNCTKSETQYSRGMYLQKNKTHSQSSSQFYVKIANNKNGSTSQKSLGHPISNYAIVNDCEHFAGFLVVFWSHVATRSSWSREFTVHFHGRLVWMCSSWKPWNGETEANIILIINTWINLYTTEKMFVEKIHHYSGFNEKNLLAIGH